MEVQKGLKLLLILPPIYALHYLSQLINYLQGLELADNDQEDQSPIEVLIGSDCYWTIVTGQTIIGEQGPVALNSKLGWLLSGPLHSRSEGVMTHSHVIIHGGLTDSMMDGSKDFLVSALQRFWNIESLGILDERIEPQSLSFLQTISFNNIINMK